MTSLPSLGPRGEGWVVAQIVAIAAVITTARSGPDWRGRRRAVTSIAGVALMAAGTLLGVGGAIANAVYNACGVRVRDYPITLDKIIAGMPRMA